MITDLRYQFFISSTFEDLREERQQIIQAVLELGHIPVGMEIFPSADEQPWEIIKRTIAECDYYVVLSAGRYGGIFPDGVSFTEREFDLATELQVPVIGFLHHAPFDLPSAKRDDDALLRRKLNAFHQKIRRKYARDWHSLEELGLLASKSINYAVRMNPRTGSVRANRARSSADLEKIEELRQEIENLAHDIETLENRNSELEDLIRRTVLPKQDLGPELLEQGDDKLTLRIEFIGSSGRSHEDISLSWDEIFAAFASELYGVIHFRDYRGKYAFEHRLTSLLVDFSPKLHQRASSLRAKI